MRINTLVVDDESTWRDLIKEILEEDGHDVVAAENLSSARNWLERRQFHLAVIDIVLGDEDGLKLLENISKLNQQSEQFCGPLVLTGYPTQERAINAFRNDAKNFLIKKKLKNYVLLKRGNQGKGFVETELLDAVRILLREVLLERNRRYEESKYILRFDLVRGQKTRSNLIGPTGFLLDSSNVLNVDINYFSDEADDLQFHFDLEDERQRLKWRRRAKHLSQSLYESIFANDTELKSSLTSARDRSKDSFPIVFRGSPEIIRLPLELLPGETSYMIMENPLVRQISGLYGIRKEGLNRMFFEKNPEVKVLLIASNTRPPIPGVDEEITLLQETLTKLFLSRSIKNKIHTVATHEASWDNIYSLLDHCQYHIVHYAGHSFHDEYNSDDSGLVFWSDLNKTGDPKPMPIRIIRNLVEHSDIRFFYLSSCVSAKSTAGASVKLKGDSFQGVAEGLVRVGIPSVIGYRWNIWDTHAKQLAISFYENLLTDFRLDLALFKARRYMQENNYYNETWASPILISQND